MTPPPTVTVADWTEHQDDISDAISDSMDMDWSANDGARAVVHWLNENAPQPTALSSQAGGINRDQVLGIVRQFASPSWCSVDRLVDTLCAALATREEAPACKTCGGKGYTEHEGGEGEGYPSRPEIDACSCREEAPAEAGEDDGLFLLMKRDLYYRPNAMGYTGIKDHAGRYTKAEAENHADPISGVTAIAAIDAPDFSPACFDDLARAHLVGKLERATRELSALRAQPVGWLRAVDEEMVCAHLGVADAEDSFETAKKKLANLIQWNIDVATDPSVGGHPAPDALRVAVEALEKIADARVFDERGEDYRGIAHPYRACRADETEQVAIKALAVLQAEQGAK